MNRRDRLALLGTCSVVTLLLELANWHRRAPTVFADEAGTLGNARWLVGGHLWRMGDASSTDIGYPLLLAPLTAAAPDPATLYRLVVLLHAVLAGCMVAVLYVLTRRGLGAPHRTALVSAVAGAAYPAVAVQTGVAWVEVFTMVGVAALLTTAVLAARQPTPLLLLSHATVGAVLSCTHGRFTPLPVLVVGALLALGVARRNGWALACGAWAMLLVLVLRRVQQAAQDDRWDTLIHPDVSAGQVFSTPVQAIARSAFGQGWYVVAGTLGLVLLGLVVLVWSTRDRFAGAYVALLVLGVFAVSVVYIAIGMAADPETTRSDNLYYGRYNECLVPTLVCAGIAAVLQPRWRRLAVTTLAGSAVLGPVLLALSFATKGFLPFTGVVQPYMVSALLPLMRLDDRNTASGPGFVWLPAMVTAALALALAALTAVRRSLGVALVLAVFVASGAYGVDRVRGPSDLARTQLGTYAALRDRHPATVAYVPDKVGTLAFYAMPFWLDESDFVSFDDASGFPSADLYLGPARWPEAEAAGLTQVAVDRVSRRAFWSR